MSYRYAHTSLLVDEWNEIAEVFDVAKVIKVSLSTRKEIEELFTQRFSKYYDCLHKVKSLSDLY